MNYQQISEKLNLTLHRCGVDGSYTVKSLNNTLRIEIQLNGSVSAETDRRLRSMLESDFSDSIRGSILQKIPMLQYIMIIDRPN